ncbi:MAG: hypothetical protein A2140_00710 [Candidatus Muproteobacteria bacterium RBG_16_62_13]|uniref:Signal peptidase n=1 Tax=Candidatus Muproteobacteria bacterium RBG_16_62_13 TaxID=1817756 RepID=A0A1F6T547_9PROT|nr:MAG: hypothetical protein A2140_00710 [Candidatus Muproteobacteria bacterium RBG_16_62_13]
MNKNLGIIMNVAIGGLIATGVLTSGNAVAAAKEKPEKCYGVVKAGKNDCQTSNTACQGSAKKDGQGDAWIYLPRGTCEKLVGASLKPKA